MTLRSTLVMLMTAALAGCAFLPVRVVGVAPHGRPTPADSAAWPLPPLDAEHLFATARMQLVTIKRTVEGVSGAFKASARFEGREQPLDVKWKAADIGDLDNWDNNPRKEIAAYIVQRWFLEPRDYLVPATAMRCVPLAEYRTLDPAAAPTIPGTSCVLGMVALWMQHVGVPDVLFDPRRFADDPTYAYYLANFNLFAYVIQHRDGRDSNILVDANERDRHVFSIDNGISFGGWIYNYIHANWDSLRVPALPRDTVEKLRHVDRRRLDELRTVAELQADAGGVLQPVEASAAIDPEQGARVVGGRVQLGLTSAEIDAVAQRIAALLERVDRGEIPTF